MASAYTEESMMQVDHTNYALYSPENDGQQHSQILGEQQLCEERILPPPSSWFADDLLAGAAPSSSDDSSVEEQKDAEEEEEESEAIDTTNNTNGRLLYREQSHTRLVDGGNFITPNHFDSRDNSMSPHRKTPPLESFRMNPTISHPRVVASKSPSWKEISSQVLPSTAKELFSSSLRRICYTARLSYAKGRWQRKYTELGNNSGGYFKPDNGYASSFLDSAKQQLPIELPPFSSLPWVDRQMVREWRTYLPEENSHNTSSTEEDVDFDRARTLVPQPITRPRWQHADFCFECRRPFKPSLLRHHCRLCGYSFCQMHSGNVHRLPHLGYDPDVPERVCDPCKRGLLAQNLAERVAWRLARCRDLESRQLTPYFDTGIDSVEEAAIRIAHAALATARKIPLGAQATVAVETVEVLRKHGLNGIYGIMLRKEFLAAADLLRKALGINKTAWPLSVHELSAAIFYALAQHRAMRGMNPDREEIIHTFIEECNDEESTTMKPKSTSNSVVIDETDEYNPDIEQLLSTTDRTKPAKEPANTELENDKVPKDTLTCASPATELSFTPVCTPVAEQTLNSLIFYAPLALNFIYATREVDMQLLAAQQGWKLLYACLNPEKDAMVTDMPASAIFVHEKRKTVCLAIRGTATIHDVVTDVRQMPVSFPEMDSTEGTPTEEWTSISEAKGLAVCGMASAAVNLFREHVDVILHLVRAGYKIRITGHSLGGGVATLLGVLILEEAKKEDFGSMNISELLRVYSYGPPSSVDASLAEFTESFVTTAILHDDVVPRLTPTSCRGLLKHLLHIRETWVKAHLTDDLLAIGERAKSAWAPRWRSGFTLASSSKLSLKQSSQSIKKYCQKKISKGTKQLMSVKGKIIAAATEIVDGTLSEEKKQETGGETGSAKHTTFDPVAGASIRDDSFSTEEGGLENDAAESNQPKLFLVEMMGGLDNRTDTVVIDGDEFFEADENLIESDEESMATTQMFADALDEARSFEEQQKSISAPEAETASKTSDLDAGAADPEESKMSNSNDGCSDDDDGPGAVVLDEIPLPRMFVPGKIVHIYSHRGVYKAAYVPRDFRELRRLSLAGNMLSDHTTQSYYESLLEVRTVRHAQELPPKWTAFDEDDTCSCCASRFTWASTSNTEAQEARDKHNCRSCGTLVCHPCSTNRIPLPSIGLTNPARICDRCYNDLGGALTGLSSMTDSFFAEQNREESRLDPHVSSQVKPERQRERRSVTVDELARKLQGSAFGV